MKQMDVHKKFPTTFLSNLNLTVQTLGTSTSTVGPLCTLIQLTLTSTSW